MFRRLAPALVLAALAAGCGTSLVGTPLPAVPAPLSSIAAPSVMAYPPTSLQISSIGVDAKSIETETFDKTTRNITVPSLKTPKVVGWYGQSAKPGQAGPAVFVSHVDSSGVQGGFFHLKEMKVGDKIVVGNGHQTFTYVTTKVQTISKGAFPSQDVYGNTPTPTLRLITCGGPLDAAHHNYLDSVIVYAEQAT